MKCEEQAIKENMGSTSISCDCSHHVILFPFMSKGHTIPLLHLAHLLLRLPRVAVTIFTTPANRPFISNFLVNTTASIVDLPFPEDVPEIAPGIESTDKLSSMSLLFVPFTRATKLMQPYFEQVVEAMPRVSFLVSDGFLWWTMESASKFGFPRFVFYGMSNYSWSVFGSVAVNRVLAGPESDDELITVTGLPWIKVTRNDFDPIFADPKPEDPHFEFLIDTNIATSNSYGMIVNSFYELEPVFVEHLNREAKHKVWCVGPLCLADPPRVQLQNPTWIQWLDQKLEQGRSVLYVAFGTQAEISLEQLKEISRQESSSSSDRPRNKVAQEHGPNQIIVRNKEKRVVSFSDNDGRMVSLPLKGPIQLPLRDAERVQIRGQDFQEVPITVELSGIERVDPIDNTRREVSDDSRTVRIYWNLEEEITKVIEKGVALGHIVNSKIIDREKGGANSHNFQEAATTGSRDGQNTGVLSADSSWNLDEEVTKVIEVGAALGVDFNSKEAEIREVIVRREKKTKPG
ncbi:hypothetical protein LWI29_015734 [Acer saccharum]|uniref:Tudor domain-containing protein n=1 Tax=Acer saccharum TaxID=4024 RepID=A0AA39VZ43_ACESA|nr:hypothetical protein LWI29_015734 [Acer saccharum]